ncbi:MAG: peptidase S10 [Candidatus Aminicenantes bacterium]|nr:peptidase S10 [Candidatus Aminicenantes bacterium]
MTKKILLSICLLGVFIICPLHSQSVQSGVKEESGFIEKDLSVTKHSMKLNGTLINYTATAGTLPLKTEDGKPKANVYFTAYIKDGGKSPAARPITFAFNGGPGSASVWVHMGAFGPKKVSMTEDGLEPTQPFQLIDNPYTILDITDLIFLDPVNTGYSRAAEGENPTQFFGYENDIESVGEFIRMYITKYERWSSPKYILGESYGTIRASGLAGFLQGRSLGMYLDGVILVSAVLNSLVKDFSPGNDLPYIYFFPGYTATAWYHKKLSQDLLDRELEDVLQEVETFCLGEYNNALSLGNELSAAKRSDLIKKVARYSGLSEDYVEQSNMRIELFRFLKELLRKEHYAIGRIDGRFKVIETDAAGERFADDPSTTATTGAFSALFNHYVRNDLKYTNENVYAISGSVRPWPYPGGNSRTSYSDSIEVLSGAMSQNQSLQIFVANGYYDFATPYFATKYAISHLGLNSEFKDRVTMAYYQAGHMMYIHEKSHQKLKEDLVKFYNRATKE